MDQIERLINAVKAVNTSIQKAQTYKDGNIFRLAIDAIVETAALSACEASTKVLTELIGSLDGVGGGFGVLDAQQEFIASTDEVATFTAIFKVLTELGSSTNEISGLAAALSVFVVATKFRGISNAVGGVSAIRLNSVQFAGPSDGAEGGGSGELDVATELIGSAAGAATGTVTKLWT